MQTTIYSTFGNPENANRAFVELLQRKANFFDLILVTRRTYQNPGFPTDDGRLDIPTQPQDAGQATSGTLPPPTRTLDDTPANRNPFGDAPGGIRLLDNLRFPGDLSACLRELGFEAVLAQSIESTVLSGGAILFFRVPSGPIENASAWEVLERCGGTVMSPSQTNPYLS